VKKLALLAISLFSINTSAIDFEDAVFPELATSSRGLAMGNAFINKVDDASAAFYNPAGLGSVRFTHLHISNFQLESNKGWIKSATSGKASDALTKFPKAFSLDGNRELLLDHRGEISHSRFHALPNFTTRYFTLGYLFSYQQRTMIGAETGGQFEYAERRDHGPYAGLNLSLFGGVIKAGVTAIVLNRKEAIGTADPNTKIELRDSDYNQGTGFILTSGLRLTIPVTFLPTFSVVSHNSAQQDFSQTSGSAAAPEGIKNTIDVGFSITPQIGRAVRIHLEANMKDVSNLYPDVGSARKILAGFELDIGRTFFMRAGYGDGFGSGGIGIKTQKLEFDLTTYAVDTTTSEFRGKEDRRFVMGFSSGF
jgi:hypothetical protein